MFVEKFIYGMFVGKVLLVYVVYGCFVNKVLLIYIVYSFFNIKVLLEYIIYGCFYVIKVKLSFCKESLFKKYLFFGFL